MILLMLFVTERMKAQISAPPVDLIQVRTTAPEAASIGRFGTIPVGNCTGVPGIGIPIDAINVGQISLPISLSYHAGGVRVDDISSCVGLGWALNANGVVARNMVGIPDETSTLGYIASPDARDVVMQGTYMFPDYMYNVHKGRADTEPDIYQYSFNGQSGKFLFKHDGSIMQIPVTNNKIVFTNNNFVITDAKGIVYIFDQRQSTNTSSDMLTYISEWRLTKMVDVNTRDTVFFSYESTCNTSYESPVIASHKLGLVDGQCVQRSFNGDMYAAMEVSIGSLGKNFFQTITHYESYLKQITWRGGKIVFVNACDRSDVTGSGQRLDAVEIYALQNGVYTLTKKCKLYQSYFFSNSVGNSTPTEKNYRLKLDSVAFLPIGTTDQPQVYRMAYNEGWMAPRESYIQDRWGFNNGKDGGYMPRQSVIYNGMYYDIGTADRSSDSLAMLACTIKSITYPTKGKTVFDFEPHRYQTNFSATESRFATASAIGGIQESATTLFTVGPKSFGYSLQAYVAPFAGQTGITDRPRVMLDDLTNNTQIFFGSQAPGNESQPYNSGRVALSLVSGHQYRLTVNLYTTSNSNIRANIDVDWMDSIPAKKEVKIGGGLRIKTVTNYDMTGQFAGRQKYEYGDDNTGVILTPQYFQDINFEKVVHRFTCLNGAPGEPVCRPFYEYESNLNPVPGYTMIYHANSIYPTSQYAGSPVLYRKVTKYDVDSVNNSNGKTVYYYQVYQDGSNVDNKAIPDETARVLDNTGVYLISNTWMNGFQTGEDIYKSSGNGYALVKRNRTIYETRNPDNLYVLKIKPKYIWTGSCEVPADATDASVSSVPIFTGAVVATSITDSTWDNANSVIGVNQDIGYNEHLLPISRQIVSSKNETLLDKMTYPADLMSGNNVYGKMFRRHILSPVVSTQRLVDGRQIMLTNFNYNDWFGDSTILMPSSIQVQQGTNAAENRIVFNRFDTYGNVLQQQKADDAFTSYIWDYQFLNPIATVKNASSTEIAFTSFEAEGNGNWSGVTAGNIVSAAGVTGKRYYTLNTAGLTKSGLTASSTYTLSYYSKNGAYTVSGSKSVTVGRSAKIGGSTWTYYEHQVTGVTSVVVSGSGSIDELRLYPAGAQMMSYTYLPLIGISSACDINNQIVYYEYDGQGRLKVVRDQDGNVLQTYEFYFRQ